MELYPEKSAFARDMLTRAGLADRVTFLVGDALDLIPRLTGPIDFVLIDHWKDLYRPSLERLLPLLAPGALLVADNIGQERTREYVDAVRSMPEMATVILPLGNGIALSRFEPTPA